MSEMIRHAFDEEVTRLREAIDADAGSCINCKFFYMEQYFRTEDHKGNKEIYGLGRCKEDFRLTVRHDDYCYKFQKIEPRDMPKLIKGCMDSTTITVADLIAKLNEYPPGMAVAYTWEGTVRPVVVKEIEIMQDTDRVHGPVLLLNAET